MSSRSNIQASAAPDAQNAEQPLSAMGWFATVLAWLIPGAGHLAQKRWGRGLLLLVAIVTMFALGLALEGKLYSFNTGDVLDMLGFVGDIGAGGLYIVSKALNFGQGNIAHATADYGTKYLIVAGLLNIISVVDAYHIAIGKKK